MNSPKERMDELVKIINEANHNYHVLDNPTITDQEYDKYLRELITLEMNILNILIQILRPAKLVEK